MREGERILQKMRIKSLRVPRGFTIVELMVAVALAALIFFGIAVVYMLFMDWWDRGTSQLNLQRDGSYALFDITNSIRGGSMVTIPSDTHLDIKNAGGGIIASYYWESADSTLRNLSGGKVVASKVDSLYFAQSGPVVLVTMVLTDAERQEAYFSTAASMRN